MVAARAARRILKALEKPFVLDGYEVVLGASIGIATWPDDGDDAVTLLRNCDAAMYHAKEQGRNSYQFYSESMNAVVFKRLLLETKLRRAIEQDDLEVHFQPKLEVGTGRIAGLEALARWRDPELGMVSPTEFIPLAEETGLIGAIGEWALRDVVKHVRAWQEKGVECRRVSINLSAHELQDEGIVNRVQSLLWDSGIDPGWIDFEITETALVDPDGPAIDTLRELRNLGISISLDDFGTGYSSLSHLRRLPIDTVKMDRSFLQRIETESDDVALVGAIISMAKVLRLRVVAEGVETEHDLDLLREMGCDEVQGNLLSPPIPGNHVPALIREIERNRRVKPE